jgi:surface carbohydrate biosynthesis protein
MRTEDIFLGKNVVALFIKELLRFDLREVKLHHRGLLYGVVKQIYYRYLKTCLELIKPKAVITFIDNSSTFGWLAKHCDNFPFMAIQNGSRLSYAADPNSGYYVPHYFCFGTHEQELFSKLGYKVDCYYPVGSLVASLYFAPKEQVEEKYDLLIVSTWRGDIGYDQDVQDTMKSMKIMDELLARYIKDNKINAAIIYRSERNSKDWIMPEIGLSEEGYYREIYGDSIEYIDTDFSKRNIFPLIQKSHLIISCLSTAVIEAYGIGKKVLYCNFSGTDLYHQDIDNTILTTDRNYKNFTEKLNSIYKSDYNDYVNDNKELMKHYMSYPDDAYSVCNTISVGVDRVIDQFELLAK